MELCKNNSYGFCCFFLKSCSEIKLLSQRCVRNRYNTIRNAVVLVLYQNHQQKEIKLIAQAETFMIRNNQKYKK